MPPPGQFPQYPGAPMPPFPGAPQNLPFPPNMPPPGFRPPFPPMGMPGMPSPAGLPPFAPSGLSGSPANGTASVQAAVQVLPPKDGVMWPDADASPVRSNIYRLSLRCGKLTPTFLNNLVGREARPTASLPIQLSSPFECYSAVSFDRSTASQFCSDFGNSFRIWCSTLGI
jgi:hypothetical protein